MTTKKSLYPLRGETGWRRVMFLIKAGKRLKIHEKFIASRQSASRKYVLDTNALVAGLRSRTGASRQLLMALYRRRYFQERMARARPEDFMRILEKAGEDIALEGDDFGD